MKHLKVEGTITATWVVWPTGWDDYDICAMRAASVVVASGSNSGCGSYEEIGEDNYTD